MSGLAGKRIEEGSEDVGTGQSGLVVAGAMAIKEGSVEHSERLAREEAETLCQGGQRNALFQANTCAKQLSERLCVQSCSQPVKKGTLLPVKKSLNSAVSPFLRPNSSVVNSSLLEAIHKVINGDSAVTTDQANTVAEGQHLGLHKVVPVRNTPVLLRMLPTNNVLVKQDGSHVTSTSKDHAMSRNATCESVIPHNGHVLQRKPMLVNGHVPNTPLAPTSVGMISVKGKDNCPKASANKKSTAPELQTILEYVNSKWSPKLQKKDLVVNNSVICKTSLASKSRPIYHPAARSNFKEDVPLLQRLDLSIGGVSLPKPAIDVGIRKTEVKKQNVCLLDRPSPFNIEENCSRITSRQVPFKDVPLLQRTDLGVDNILPCKRPGNMSSKNGSNNVIDCSSINDTAAEHLSAHHSAILNREAFLQGKDQTFHDLSSCEPMTNSYCKEMAVTGKRDDLFNHVSEEEPATKRSKIIVPQLDSLMLQRKYPTFNDVLNDRPVMATYSIRDFEGDQTDLTNTPVMLVGSAKHQERMNCLTLQNKKSFLQKMNRVNNIESICQPTVNSDRKKEVCKSISSPFRYTDIEKSITEASDLQKPIRSVGSNAQETCPSVNKAIRSGDTHVQLDHSYVSSVVRSCDTEVHKNDPPVSTVGIPQVIVCVNGREIRLEEEHVDSSGNTIREEASHVHNHSHQSLVEEYCSFETESRKQQQQAAVSVDVNDVSKEKCAPQIIVPSSMDNSAVVHYPQSDSSLINIQEKGDNEDKNLIQDNCNFIGVNDSAIEGSARPRYSISATDTQVLSENCQILSSDQQSVSEERRQEVKLNVSFTDFTNPHISLHHDKAHSISGDCLITQQSVLLNNTEMASEGTDSFTNKQTSQECDITQEMNVHAENPFLWHAREETVDSTFEPSPASGHREAIIEGSSSTTGLQSPNMFEVDPDQQYSVPLENMGLWYIKEEIVENDLTYSPTQETGNKEQIFKNHDSDMLKHAEKDCSNTHKAGEQNSVSLANTVLWQVKETLAEFDSSSQLPPSQGSSRNRVFEEQVINVPTKSGSAVTNPPVTNPPVTYQLTPSVKSTNIGLNVNYQSVGRSSPNQLPKPTIHRIGFLQQGRCATSPILHRGCATSSNLQRGCATSPIFHRGCATSSNLQQGCATSPILHRGSATSPILQRGCATSPLLQRGCATTNSTPGRGPVSACNIVISMRPNLRPHLPGLVRQRCPMPLEREFDVAVSPTLSSEVVVKRPVPATVELIKRVKEKLGESTGVVSVHAGNVDKQVSMPQNVSCAKPLPGKESLSSRVHSGSVTERASFSEGASSVCDSQKKQVTNIPSLASKSRPDANSGSDVTVASGPCRAAPLGSGSSRRLVGGLYADVIRETNVTPEPVKKAGRKGYWKFSEWQQSDESKLDKLNHGKFQTFSQFRAQQVTSRARAGWITCARAVESSPPRGREPACAAADASSAGAWPVQCRGPQQPSRPARILPDKLQTDCKEEVQGRWERLKRRGRPKKRHTFDHPTHPDDRPSETMMDLMYSNPPSNPMRKDSAAAKEPMIFGDDEWDEDEDEDQVTDEAVPAPQVTLDKDGGLVIDERSLFVDVEEVARRRARRGRKKAEDSLAAAICSEQPQPRHRRSKMWRTEETLRFYRALNAVGTDFMMMESLFLDRTRRELKKKFMREDKINRELIDRTLLNPGVVSTTDLERELGEERLKKMREEEQMLEKARLKKERKERRMTKNNQKLLAERKEKLLNNKILFRNKRNYKRTRRKERSPPPPRKVLPPRKAAMKQRRGEQPEGGEDLCRLLEESISRELAGESTPQAAVTQVTTTPGALLVLSAPSATGRVYKVFMVD
ncbi:uncharacterized protein LOC134540498 isoform X2 [Bacillus rossius redtenbacheri]|uniref:uncharacterized protein LOC134540498 isoform X2 n=1 Tax=Bacillus rossius redtenbacheri TaxID=93214 RepID=UPI002FDD15EB